MIHHVIEALEPSYHERLFMHYHNITNAPFIITPGMKIIVLTNDNQFEPVVLLRISNAEFNRCIIKD